VKIDVSTVDRPTTLNSTDKPKEPADHDEVTGSGEVLSVQHLTIIDASRSWVGYEIDDIWAHRELLYFLVWRDLKVRYKQTALGVAWVVLQPLLMTIIFTVVLGSLLRVSSSNVPYPLFAYAGLVLWTFFAAAASATGNCLVSNAHLITKIYFPRLMLPLAIVCARLVDLGVVLIILIGLMLYYRIPPSTHLLLAPLFILLLALFALAFGLWTSAVNVKYRDVALAMPVLLQLWMFASPVVYSLDMVSPKLRLLFLANPLVGILQGFRAALFGTRFDWRGIAVSVVITVVLLIYGAYAFQRREKTFADIV